MRRWRLAFAALAAAAATGAAIAQDRGGDSGPFGEGRMGWRGGPGVMNSADREAFAEARIAALRAGLRLNAEQEKLWPPVEDAIRGLVRQRQEAREIRRERFMSMREDALRDLPGAMRFMADRRAASAEALRRLADASAPLWATLDEAQKRRLFVLARMMRPGGGGGPMWRERGPMGPDGMAPGGGMGRGWGRGWDRDDEGRFGRRPYEGEWR